MERARDILGVRQDWLGFVDSGWPEGDPKPPLPEGCFALVPLEEATERAGAADPRLPPARRHDVRRARRLPAPRPHPVPRGLRRGLPRGRRPGALPRRGGAVAAAEALLPPRLELARRPTPSHEAMLDHGLESPYAERLENWEREPEWDDRITTRVPCGDYFGVRDQALLAHATQIDPDGFWFAIPREIQQKVWPTEDYELVESTSRAPTAGGRPVRRHPDARSLRAGCGTTGAMLAPAARPGSTTRRPSPSDVKAGPLGFAVWIFLILAGRRARLQPGQAAAQGAGRQGRRRLRRRAGRARRGRQPSRPSQRRPAHRRPQSRTRQSQAVAAPRRARRRA